MKAKYLIIALAACLGITAVVALVFFGWGLYEHQRAEHPPVPVTVGYRKALTGAGDVVRVQNESAKVLPIKLTLSNETFNRKKSYDFVLDGGKFKEVGYREGWTCAPGDKIEVVSDGYSTLFKEIPKQP